MRVMFLLLYFCKCFLSCYIPCRNKYYYLIIIKYIKYNNILIILNKYYLSMLLLVNISQAHLLFVRMSYK